VFAAASKPTQSVDFVHPMIHGLLQLWPLWLVVAGLAVLRLARDINKTRRLRRAGIFDIDRMDGTTFELRLEALFRSLGYRAEVVGSARGDYGGDLVIAKDGKRSVVQAKCWRKNVGVKAVQEVVAARGYYSADSAFVVTNRHFTQQAQELAKRNDVKLWGRPELTDALLRAQKGSASQLVEHSSATTVATEAPVQVAGQEAFCAGCGESVSVKVRDYCLADADRFAGLVYCFKDQKAFRR
jgi:restriction system protein